MGYALRNGTSFCRVGGRILFLDLCQDRYFCLSPAANSSFVKLIERQELSESDAGAIQRLTREGLLIEVAGNLVPLACRPAPMVEASLLDIGPERAGWPEILACAVSLGIAPMALRMRGLASVVNRLRSEKSRASCRALSPQRLRRTAKAFAGLRYVATEHDRCLTHSLAIARRLIALGGCPDFVIAVKLQPFKAHAWVQCEDWVVNDRPDVIGDFTPILIV